MEAGYHVVARFAKPHGLKGEAIVHPLTDRPEAVFVAGRRLVPVDDAGRPAGAPLTVERARPYHRRWLLKFAEVGDRTTLEAWPPTALGVREEDLPRSTGGLDAREVPGVTVVRGGARVGTAVGVIPVAGGRLLVVDVEGREILVPYRAPIVIREDRDRREIEIDPPAGLLEL